MVFSLGTPSLAAAPLEGYPTVDELEASDTIPDPFQFFDVKNDPNGDGVVSDVAEWSARREEIKDLVQHYWLGYRWPTASEDVKGGVVIVEEPNTVSYGGFWGMGATVFNLGTVFSDLVALIQTEGVTVNDVTYGPEADAAKAQELAIQAWNAGYGLPYNAYWFVPGGTAVFVNNTGKIDENSIPKETKFVERNIVTIRNGLVEKSFYIQIYVPTDEQKIAAWGRADVDVPFVLGIGSVFKTDSLTAQGYGHVVFTPTDIYSDSSGANPKRTGIYTELYPYNADEYEYASGALMAWAWGASQIVTALSNEAIGAENGETFGEVVGLDPTRTVVTGHSRYGKAAMFAAAFDERFSICVPSEPGGSGIQSYRYKVEGKIFNWNTSYYPKADRVYGRTETPTVSYGSGNSWFPETAAALVNHDDKFPFDASDIIALVAPRPFFVVSGIDTHWLGNEGGVASVMAAAEVYNFIGKDEVEKNNIAVRCRQSDHAFYNQDFCFALAIMDREFGKPGSEDGILHVQDLFPNGTNYASMSYPAADYNTVSELTSHPFEISSYYMPWSSPNKYILWTAQDNFLTDHDVTITAHSNAPDVDLYTPDGVRIDAAESSGDEFIFHVSAEQAVYGRYMLCTVGSEKENRSVYFSAISLSDALRHGTTKGDEGEENRVLGFSSRLANNAENPPVVYIDGKATTMSFNAGRVKEEETTLLAYGIQFHDPLFVRIANEGWDETKTFSVKNLKFVTLPEYTFEFSMADIYASAANNGKDGAAKFTKAISWPVERYNNGEADVWPLIPNTLEERQILEAGGTITRPEAPEPHTTDFDAMVVSKDVLMDETTTTLVIEFSEPLNTGEYAFGFDAVEDWTTSWNAAGDQLIIRFRNVEAKNIHMILFRLMDLDGNLIAGPMELSFNMETADYTASVYSAETAVEYGDTVYFNIVANKTFAASEFMVTYDSTMFTFDPDHSLLRGATYVEKTPGTLMFSDHGAENQNGYTLAFVAKDGGRSQIKLTEAAFGKQVEAEISNLKDAAISPDFLLFTVNREKYTVELPDIYIGSTIVSEGEDYTFYPKDNANYDYGMPTVTMNGEEAAITENTDGSWTVSNVTGDLVVAGERTAKSYPVRFEYDGEPEMKLPENGTASYGTDYTFTMPAVDNYIVSASVTIGGEAYTPSYDGDQVTIAGNDIKGEIVVTFAAATSAVVVTVSGNGAADVVDFVGIATPGEDYVLTLNPEKHYQYTVTATVNGADYALTVDGNTYTVLSKDFHKGDVIAFTVEKELILGDIEVSEYLTLDRTEMWLVQLGNEKAADVNYAYDGTEMFWSDEYESYCVLIVSDTEPAADASAFTLVKGAAKAVDYSGDVNMTGLVDTNDAQLIYNMYNAYYNGFTANVTMEKFLRADKNADGKVDVLDAQAIIHDILK